MSTSRSHSDLMAASAIIAHKTRKSTEETNESAAKLTRWTADFIRQAYENEVARGNQPVGWKNHLRIVQ